MNDREGALVAAMLGLALVLWLGFVVHRAPRFAGSLAGGALGVAAAVLMLVPLIYAALKRLRSLRAKLAQQLQLGRALAWHAYAGVAGAALAILHSGHRFESVLGVTLIAAMLVSVVSGFVGRHLVRLVSQDLRERTAQLGMLRQQYATALQAAQSGAAAGELAIESRWAAWRRALASRIAGSALGPEAAGAHARLGQLIASIAELEYAVAADERLKRWLAVWLVVHVSASLLFYGLLALHVASSINYGLRWFD